MKTQSKHTPGPWQVGIGLHILGGGCKIAQVKSLPDSSYKIAYVEMEANARLIAAAPLMYEWIKRFADQECYRDTGEYPQLGEAGKAPCLSCQAKEIIAKTEGRES